MPVIKSAQKRVRQEAKRRERNRIFKKELRQLTKRVEAAIADKDTKKLNELLPKLQSKLDRAVKKNQIPANTVQRRMSRLTRLAKDAGAKPYSAAKSTTTKKSTSKATTKKKPAAKKATTKKKPAAKKSTAKKPAAKKAKKK